MAIVEETIKIFSKAKRENTFERLVLLQLILLSLLECASLKSYKIELN
jgi:hypothetical protein